MFLKSSQPCCSLQDNTVWNSCLICLPGNSKYLALCLNIPLWGVSLNPPFLDGDTESKTIGQGHPVSQQQNWEHNPDFLTPLPYTLTIKPHIPDQDDPTHLSQCSAWAEGNCILTIFLSNMYRPFQQFKVWSLHCYLYKLFNNHFSSKCYLHLEGSEKNHIFSLIYNCIILAVK